MTINEQVAKVMGWEYTDSEKYWYSGMACAKYLQQRMVDDGWRIDMTVEKHHSGKFDMFTFVAVDKAEIRGTTMRNEPSAIFELFCKVHNIKEEA